MKMGFSTSRMTSFGLSIFLFSVSRDGLAQTAVTNNVKDGITIAKTDKKRDDIRKLIAVMGTKETLKRTLPQLLNQMERTMPQVPEKYWREWETNFDFNKLVEIYVPIYDKYFTDEEIGVMMQYYQSPVGKKFVAIMPKATEEVMMGISAWGKQLGEVAQKRLQSEQEAKATSTHRLESTDPDYKAWLLRKQGYDPNEFEMDDDGNISRKIIRPGLGEPAAASTRALPGDVRYLVTVEKANGQSDVFLSKLEPDAYGAGFKFRSYPDDTEIIVSGNVTVRKLDHK